MSNIFFSEERIFVGDKAKRKRLLLILAVMACLALMGACVYAIAITFYETVLILTPEHTPLFVMEKGQALGAILFAFPVLIIMLMFCPGFINRRFKPSILSGLVKVGTVFMIASFPAMIIGSIYTESYLEGRGYVRCGYYTSTSYTSNDFYVYDPKFCNEEGTLVSSKVRDWLEAQNGKAEPDYDEFLAVISQALEERHNEIYRD
ncbi:hypothetical protein CWC31_15340 [Pseudoalteromonas ruthenica]|uniref:DUF1240 domain-containing protein n=1 Tax=Pseudoalteromonas ruthenica TaxID=151081 RepID=UPI0011080FE4|nr:DUF1240 domain-containing protein [Pseudoalteromonas ruthenica]TLX49833.1 hypothetical protein CWC31_15340 [Pseudoalteromonas ruthenica]